MTLGRYRQVAVRHYRRVSFASNPRAVYVVTSAVFLVVGSALLMPITPRLT